MSSEGPTCRLCGRLYCDPLMLPCLHCFCKECLVAYTETQDAIVCPTCNDVSSKPQNGVFALPQDIHLNHSAKAEALKAKLVSRSADCERCTRKSLAVSYCSTCCRLLCSHCKEDHLSVIYWYRYQHPQTCWCRCCKKWHSNFPELCPLLLYRSCWVEVFLWRLQNSSL